MEAGAYDGELFSNSLLFETKLGWSGILIEPNPVAFDLLLKKQRKAWSINACLSKVPYPEVIEFDASGVLGGVIQHGIHPSKLQVMSLILAILYVYNVIALAFRWFLHSHMGNN